MTLDELTALTLPWAKEHNPKAYRSTLAVSTDPAKFRAYMARIVELMHEDNPQSVSMWALEETSLVIRMRTSGGREIAVAGKRAEGERTWSFAELAQMLELGVKDLDAWADDKDRLDLVLDDGQFDAADRMEARRKRRERDAALAERAAERREREANWRPKPRRNPNRGKTKGELGI